jgi:hypothetical protein
MPRNLLKIFDWDRFGWKDINPRVIFFKRVKREDFQIILSVLQAVKPLQRYHAISYNSWQLLIRNASAKSGKVSVRRSESRNSNRSKLGLSVQGGRAESAENLRASPFKDDLCNDIPLSAKSILMISNI